MGPHATTAMAAATGNNGHVHLPPLPETEPDDGAPKPLGADNTSMEQHSWTGSWAVAAEWRAQWISCLVSPTKRSLGHGAVLSK